MHETPSLTKNLQSSDEYSDKPRPAETNKVSVQGYQENRHPLASSEVDFRGMGLLQQHRTFRLIERSSAHRLRFR
jgi:hypothetical protein